jgi:hypothetical protein
MISSMDPSLLFLNQFVPPPERPLVVEERLLLSKKGEAVAKAAERAVVGYASYIGNWAEKIETVKALYHSTPLAPVTETEASMLNEMIQEVESFAEIRARNTSAFRKRSEHDIKRMREPSIAAVSRDTARKLTALDEEVIEKLLEYALFLRAARSERTPNNIASQSFSDPAELRSFLKRSAA